MKQLFLLLLIINPGYLIQAQTRGSDKLYGYKEPVVRGTNPSYIEEGSGQKSGAVKEASNYFVYIQSESRIYPSEMWIGGDPYSVTIATVSTPVERVDESQPASPVSKTLVPQTSQKVVSLTPAAAIQEKLSKMGKKLAESNELVVIYKKEGKFYYLTLASMTSLEPAVKQ